MTVHVRLFALLRERARRDRVELRLPPGATVAEALSQLAAQAPLAELLERMPISVAVNREYAGVQTRLQDGDELALIPPVSGGEDAERVHVRVGEASIALRDLAARVSRPGAGAIVVFAGTTREVERLDYEAYAEMAQECIERILEDCIARHGLEAAAAEHRTGSVALGQIRVAVAVSAAHVPPLAGNYRQRVGAEHRGEDVRPLGACRRGVQAVRARLHPATHGVRAAWPLGVFGVEHRLQVAGAGRRSRHRAQRRGDEQRESDHG